jgi:hypothetical protein
MALDTLLKTGAFAQPRAIALIGLNATHVLAFDVEGANLCRGRRRFQFALLSS